MSKSPNKNNIHNININNHSPSKRKNKKKSSTNSLPSSSSNNNVCLNCESENTLPNTPSTVNSKKENRKSQISKIKKEYIYGKHVSFKKNYLQVILVESYKKYNLENTCEDPSGNGNVQSGNTRNNKVHCKCNIF